MLTTCRQPGLSSVSRFVDRNNESALLSRIYSMRDAAIVVLAILLAGIAVNSASGQNYPATQYNSFGGFSPRGSNQGFATSRPMQPDSPVASSSSDYRSMSPDSWESPSVGSNSNPAKINNPFAVGGQTKSVVIAPQPNSDLAAGTANSNSNSNQLSRETLKGQSNAFQPAGFSRSQQLPNAPEIPNDIRQIKPVPDAVFNPQFQLPNSQPFPQLDPGSNDFGAASDSIIRGPQTFDSTRSGAGANVNVQSPRTTDPLPSAPPNPWSYPDSRITGELPGPGPKFRTDLGHREPAPIDRNPGGSEDWGQRYDHEGKHTEYPKLGEILKTGRYFGSATALYLRPSFTGNSSISQTNSGQTETFDFDYEVAPQFQIGFESKFGPGIELTYWQFDETSNDSVFTSDGIEAGTTSAWMVGSNQWSRLTADNAGETLTANHTIDVESVGANFFKEVKLPISRINGKFGVQYVSITHDMNARVTNAAAVEIGSLRARSDLHAFGPQLKLEYFRPVGHTKVEFVTAFGASVLFGRQDQFVVNSATGNLSRVGADEFLTIFDFFAGAQYRKMMAENRYWFVRGGVTSQAWLNGGTAVLPQDDFGVRGLTFSVGYNR